jgi:hypothetical protein
LSAARGIVIIVACGIGFGTAGGLLGFALALGAPAYYRGVFRAGNDPRFNAVQVGIGLGITQGLTCGAVIGSVVVLAAALSGPTHQKGEPDGLWAELDNSDRLRSSRVRRVFALIAILLAIACSGVVGFVIGAVVGETELYRQSTDAKLAKIRPVLREPQFAGINAEYSTAAQVYLMGKVGSRQTYKALEERMRFLFGDQEAKFMMGNIVVAKE